MRTYSVVVLDDEELIIQSLVSLIDWAGLGCYIAATGTDGVAGSTILKQLRPDIVITDIRMPGASGLDIARYCAQHLPQCQVILLSAYADFHYAQEAIQQGAFAYLLKPIDKSELTSVIRRAVDKQRAYEDTAAARRQMQADMENARTMATSSMLFNLARYGTTGAQGALSAQAEAAARRPGVVFSIQFFNASRPAATILAEGQQFWQRALRQAGWQPIFGSASEKLILTCELPQGIDHTTARNRLAHTVRQLLEDLPQTLGFCVVCLSAVYAGLHHHRLYGFAGSLARSTGRPADPGGNGGRDRCPNERIYAGERIPELIFLRRTAQGGAGRCPAPPCSRKKEAAL